MDNFCFVLAFSYNVLVLQLVLHKFHKILDRTDLFLLDNWVWNILVLSVSTLSCHRSLPLSPVPVTQSQNQRNDLWSDLLYDLTSDLTCTLTWSLSWHGLDLSSDLSWHVPWPDLWPVDHWPKSWPKLWPNLWPDFLPEHQPYLTKLDY
jgi:hypothetical protein